jgi:Tfp pilus assembly protein PilX
MKRSREKEKGAALIFAMIFVAVLTIMGVSMMFLSQSETWSSLNYRLMTQARYGAEAGVQAGAAYLTNPANGYTPPGTASDPLSGYNTTVSPVTRASVNANPIALGATVDGVSANYPVSLTNAFPGTGSVMAGNTTVNYSVSAKLLAMRQVTQCGNGLSITAQTWQLTSHGDIQGVRNAEAEVSAILEQQVLPCYPYAGFGTGNGCNVINFNGGGTIDSYDSAAVNGNAAPSTQAYDGNLGSNGTLNTATNTTVAGTFSSPRVGANTTCQNGSVQPALSGNTTAVSGCQDSTQLASNACGNPLVKLAQPFNPTPPTTDYPTCSGSTAGSCDATILSSLPSNPGSPLTPGNYGNLSASGGTSSVITLNPGTDALGHCIPGVYYINSISLSGQASLQIGACPGTGTNNGNNAAQYQPIVVNIVGSGISAPSNVLDIGGNGFSNPSYDPSLLQIQYAGTAGINLHGNGSSSAVLFAPNSPITFSGNANWYGSVIGNTIQSNGNATVSIHYDRRLADKLFNVGNWTMNSFTWSKF